MESWSGERAAEYFVVTPECAVRLRQGNRTDLRPVDLDAALSIDDTAAAIAATDTDDARLRLFFEFLRGSDAAGLAALLLVGQEPRTTGDPRFDALLAAAAERLCARYNLPGPPWTDMPARYLPRAWWVSDLPSAKLLAIKWTPASFVRRGIYLDVHDLTQDGKTPLPQPVFGQPEIKTALHLLAAKLQHRNLIGHVHVVDGKARLLAYEARTITCNADAIFAPNRPIVDTIHEIAHENHWPLTWLHNHAGSYTARNLGEGMMVFDHPHLQVMAIPAEHLLAMKVLAARDASDAIVLLRRMNIRTAEAVWKIVDRFLAASMISDRSRTFVDDIIAGEPTTEVNSG